MGHYHFVEVLLDHVAVLVVTERLLDVEAHQVQRDALVQPPIGPLLGRDEAAVILPEQIKLTPSYFWIVEGRKLIPRYW